MALDLDALADRLRRYDPNVPRCEGTVDQQLDLTEACEIEEPCFVRLPRPCMLPVGHDGPCQRGQPMLLWPGHAALCELLADAREARDLRGRVRALEEQVQRQDDELTDLALQSRYTSSALDGWEDKIDHMRSSYETTIMLRDEEIAQLKARLA